MSKLKDHFMETLLRHKNWERKEREQNKLTRQDSNPWPLHHEARAVPLCYYRSLKLSNHLNKVNYFLSLYEQTKTMTFWPFYKKLKKSVKVSFLFFDANFLATKKKFKAILFSILSVPIFFSFLVASQSDWEKVKHSLGFLLNDLKIERKLALISSCTGETWQEVLVIIKLDPIRCKHNFRWQHLSQMKDLSF